MLRKLLIAVAVLCAVGGSVGHTAQAHILNPLRKPVAKMTLRQQEHYYRQNILHAKYTLEWFHSIQGNWALDAKRYPLAFSVARVIIENHTWLLKDSEQHLKQVEQKLHPAPVITYGIVRGVCASCWDRVAQCESSGNWYEVTGNGFYWGLQWIPSTWDGRARVFGYPTLEWYVARHSAPSREMQITAANGMSLSNWPVCGKYY